MKHFAFRYVVEASLLLLVCGISAPQLRSQALATEADWKTVNKEVSRISHHIRSLKEQIPDLNQQSDMLLKEEEQLESKSCTSSDNQRDGCESNSSTKAEMEQRRRVLLEQAQADEKQLLSLEDQLASQLAKIRASAVLQGHEAWTERLKKCAALPAADAATCFGEAQREHPRSM